MGWGWFWIIQFVLLYGHITSLLFRMAHVEEEQQAVRGQEMGIPLKISWFGREPFS
jgi:hypothetical protein